MTKFAICTSPMMFLVCPQKFVQALSAGKLQYREEMTKKSVDNYRGQTRCFMGDVQMANSRT